MKTKKQPNRSEDAKIVIYSRIDPQTVKALDAIREAMRPVPTRAQLIDLAVADFVAKSDIPARPTG